ncbi:EAL domain-containing protein [Celerinatantimonas sp. YJH-8]|uniref:EAL domain-containing protein n=1 Tax=Celerinatantimonas sp. YJH-8 TaxID=3228714 RepID=UPI0038C77604
MPEFASIKPDMLKSHWQKDTLCYVVALCIIAILALFSHYLVQSIVSQQEATARVVNLAGRQRMLSQRITLFAKEIQDNPSSSQRVQLIEEYKKNIQIMTQMHQALMHGSPELMIPAPTSVKIQQIFNAAPVFLDQKIQSFLKNARFIEQRIDTNQPFSVIFRQLDNSAHHDILNALDTLVFQFQKDSETAIAKLQTYNQISLIGMLITLIMEAFLIFRPLLMSLYRRENQYLKLLKEMEDEISEQVRDRTFNDLLTGLPNRVSMLEKIRTCIQLVKQGKAHLVIISIGLDRFKDINNSLGHDRGDELLLQISKRLSHFAGQHDGFIGRITGDEFVLLLDKRKEHLEIVHLMQQLSNRIAMPYRWDKYNVQLTASMGLAFYREDGSNARRLLLHANQAMRTAKDEGGHCFRFFQPTMTTQMTRRIMLEQDLRKALLATDQLILYYQPKVQLETDRIVGMEALIRWEHPEQGLLPPDEFIPIAEDSGLIIPLGEWVIKEAFRQMKLWHHQGFPINMAINISVKQLLDENIIHHIAVVSQKLSVDPADVQLEITENNMMDNLDYILSQLRILEQCGFTLAIDDFGTGHSSLANLRDLPMNVLKIDKSFVTNAMLDKRDRQIVAAIIEMGHSLDKLIIAEGIETPDQMEFLKQLGCDQGQGYLFSKPLPALDMTHLLVRYNSEKITINS